MAGQLQRKAREAYGDAAIAGNFELVTRFRYNPDLQSIVAIVPAVIPLLLLMIPAILAALSVVREKELGSIINLYVTPATRFEFLLGKQLAYVALAFVNFLLMTFMALTIFGVPFTGSFATLTLSAILYVIATTAIGLFISVFISSQITALFATAMLTMIPGVQYSGLIDPVSALSGAGRIVGEIYPTSWFITVARGTFSKGLGFEDLSQAMTMIALAIPVVLGLATLLLRKQAR